MLHREYGVGNAVVDGPLTPLENDIGKLTKRPLWALGMVEIGEETN